MRHNSKREIVVTHVLVRVGSGRRTEQRESVDAQAVLISTTVSIGELYPYSPHHIAFDRISIFVIRHQRDLDGQFRNSL
jgi:hypothetical protein